jgi:MFS family permease
VNGRLDELLKERVRKARGRFAAMAATYFVGVFNDNFFKQTALIMAIALNRPHLQGYAAFIFTLPFILFAAPAGWCADRFPKRSIVIIAKLLELAAMIFGAFGIYYVNWTLILVMLGIEGLQAAVFSPALNGAIPELYPAEYVLKANAIIRMISTTAILAGIAAAGFVLDVPGSIRGVPLNRIMVAAVVICISAVGVVMSFAVPKFPAASPRAPLPWKGPIDTVKTLLGIRGDLLLAVSIIANAFFWYIATLGALVVNQLGLSEFALSASATSSLVVAELLGIALGGLLSTRLVAGKRWYRALPLICILMALCMVSIAALGYVHGLVRGVCLAGTLFVMGAGGGAFMIPLESFIQVRPAADRKGATIAASNFAAFTGILFSGPTINLFNLLAIPPSKCFLIMGLMAIIAAVWLFLVLPRGKMHD